MATGATEATRAVTGPLTERQREVLDFIVSFKRINGWPPTLREIGDALGIRSPNGVKGHLDAMVKKGWLVREANRARAMQVVFVGRDGRE